MALDSNINYVHTLSIFFLQNLYFNLLSQVQIKKKSFLLRCIHHFESDLINNIDHMRIFCTEPSSVILSQKMKL